MVIDLELEAGRKRKGSVYGWRCLFDAADLDQTAEPMAPDLAGFMLPLYIRGVGRADPQLVFFDVEVHEPAGTAAVGSPAVYKSGNWQILPNRSSRAGAVPVEASTEAELASQRLLRVVAKLAALAQLPAGWDGLDAPAADHRAINRALSLIDDLGARARLDGVVLPEPMIGPAGLGSVQLEWQEGRRFMAVQVPATAEPLSFYAEIDDIEELPGEAQPERIWEVVRAMAESEA
jgi:hypothetical protein